MQAGDGVSISDREFSSIQGLLHSLTGIYLAPSKKVLLAGRLGRRLRALGLEAYADYYRFVTDGAHADELQTMVDLLTTNETYFFREPRHFEFLVESILPGRRRGTPFHVWSAACASGEEAYTLAMVLAEALGEAPWQITASDISVRALEQAQRGLYPLGRAGGIPPDHLRKYCLKGVGEHAGTLLVSRALRTRIDFRSINLNEPLPAIGPFDVIFLRNAMIYFDAQTKRKVVAALVRRLKPDGWFVVGHSETLNGVTDELVAVRPTLYRHAEKTR